MQMALFERCYSQILKLDDTQEIHCTIETAQTVNGHTEYVLRLQRGHNKTNSWRVLRRYNDFAELHKSLSISGIELPMPAKKLFGNMHPEFIAERRKALQQYIDAVLMNPILASSLPAKRFVDPDSYSQSFHDQAVQNSLLCLRSEGVWSLGATLGPIGWRVRKHYFQVTPKPPDKAHSKLLVKSGSQQTPHHHNKNLTTGISYSSGGSLDVAMYSPFEMVLEWLEYGPDKYLDDKELAGVLKSLTGLQHNHIECIVSASNNENGCLVIRKFHKHGTLKDMLCMATPKNPFLSKYGNPKGRTALTINEVANYGRQILEALIFLHAKGFPYGHLHSGNVVIVDGCVKLLDIENYILGVPAFYRPFFVQHSKLHTLETIDVYCFGHVLFEMTFGYPMQESILRQLNDCPKSLKHLLEAILSKEACRVGLPTLEQLLAHQFFTEYAQKDNCSYEACCSGADDGSGHKPHLKLSLNAKEQLALAIQKSEHRLREEQKSVKNQKRMVRVQELMSSEEEKRKSKHKAKVDQKQLKLKQQNSLQTSNGRQQHQSSIEQAPHTTASIMSRFSRTDSVGIFKESRAASTSLSSEKSADRLARSPKREATAPVAVERQSSSPNMATDIAVDEEEEPVRSALLESICKFNRGSLRKVRSND